MIQKKKGMKLFLERNRRRRYISFNINRECDIMSISLMDRKMIEVLCAKAVGMDLSDNLHRDGCLVAFN